VRQMVARSNPTPEYARKVIDWLGDGRLWAFDAQGTTDWRRMLEVFRYARRRYGVDLFVVDNMTGLGIGEEDYQGQKALALALSNFARDENCHVWLVHHIRKGNSEHEQPDKMDIKGSGAITDLASTVLTVWRNKPKENKRKAAALINAPLSDEDEKAPDVRVTCSKQRNYGGVGNGEPAIALWWNGDAYHYLSAPDHLPRPMFNPDRMTRVA
jgi:twinkle protein